MSTDSLRRFGGGSAVLCITIICACGKLQGRLGRGQFKVKVSFCFLKINCSRRQAPVSSEYVVRFQEFDRRH